jgi:hypothetical protein
VEQVGKEEEGWALPRIGILFSLARAQMACWMLQLACVNLRTNWSRDKQGDNDKVNRRRLEITVLLDVGVGVPVASQRSSVNVTKQPVSPFTWLDRMFLKHIDLTTALRPSYLPDEVLLFVQDNVGLYEG